jgi:tRNA(fMet)-specific endonuclease VapC
VGLILDTSVVIEVEHGRMELTALAARSPDPGLAVTAITVSELLHGLHRSGTSKHRPQREQFIDRIIRELTVLPFDLDAARIHARVWADLSRRGVNVGAHDLLIASIALAQQSQLATLDKRSFPKIGGLEIIQW